MIKPPRDLLIIMLFDHQCYVLTLNTAYASDAYGNCRFEYFRHQAIIGTSMNIERESYKVYLY